jgi:hypothetical protein
MNAGWGEVVASLGGTTIGAAFLGNTNSPRSVLLSPRISVKVTKIVFAAGATPEPSI